MERYYNLIWKPVFEDGDGGTDDKITLTTEELDVKIKSAIDEAVTPFKETTQQYQEEISLLQKQTKLTADEKTKLETRLKELREKHMTDEQLKAEAAKAQEEKHKQEIEKLSSEGSFWKSQFEESTIRSDITSAAVTQEGWDPDQFHAILRPNAKIAEVIGDDNKPTGQFTTQITFHDTDKDGKPVKLTLSAHDAIKRMKEMEKHANLFKGKGKSGFGGQGGVKEGEVNIRELAKDPEAYRKAREDGTITFK
jgi:regulator of replication initiation timing